VSDAASHAPPLVATTAHAGPADPRNHDDPVEERHKIAPRTHAGGQRSRPIGPPARDAAGAGAPSSCDPPFTIDSLGRQIFEPDCL
jgi:hypothetical protein